jgi:hypothetical protein
VIATDLKSRPCSIDSTQLRRSLASGSRARLPTPAEPERVAPVSASRNGPVPREVHQNGAGNSAVFCLALVGMSLASPLRPLLRSATKSSGFPLFRFRATIVGVDTLTPPDRDHLRRDARHRRARHLGAPRNRVPRHSPGLSCETSRISDQQGQTPARRWRGSTSTTAPQYQRVRRRHEAGCDDGLIASVFHRSPCAIRSTLAACFTKSIRDNLARHSSLSFLPYR